MDFGGELGGFYRMAKKLRATEAIRQWLVVETPAMAAAGGKAFTDGVLEFGASFETHDRFDIVIASGALQCVERPFEMLVRIKNTTVPFIILSIVPLTEKREDIIVARPGEYPLWMFSRAKFHSHLVEGYDVIAEWSVPKEDMVGDEDRTKVSYAGYLIRRRPEPKVEHWHP